MTRRESRLVKRWKKWVLTTVENRFGDAVSLKAVEAYLDKIVEQELRVPTAYWVNNFRRRVVKTDALAAIEFIEDSNLIVGGAGVTFLQHDAMPNPMRNYIIKQKQKRVDEKHTRDNYERGRDRFWDIFNTKQNNTKTVMNSLYGVLGYAKFIFHNIFLAESITRMGRNIIATAACGFENFLADNIKFSTSSELFEYVDNILAEYDEKYKDHLNFGILGVNITSEDTINRLLDKCSFPIPADVKRNLAGIVNRACDDARILLYYKNNFLKFNRIPVIKAKIMKIIGGIDELLLPKIDKIKDPAIQEEVQDLWKFYDTFVFYNRPIYDQVRKMAYGSREAVLYIDTDSNFIALNRWVQQIRHEFFEDKYPQESYKDFVFICANIITIFLTTVVDRNLKMFARNCGISEEWVSYLSMKNEFFFWRILFGDVKKRYIDLQMIQEGKILKGGAGITEIKGYDFRKNVTKKYIRDYYTALCTDEILRPDEINLSRILTKLDWLKKEIRRSMEAGESTYFKQANVSSPEHYADPIRMPGIRGVMIWNALCPTYPIDLPAEVDLVPIRNLSSKKGREWFAANYPEEYARLEKEIFNNRNPNIAGMSINVVAKPKNDTIPMPAWLSGAMNYQKIVNDSIKLINPIMDSLGMKIQRPTTTKEFLTNIVDL